ncbi:MAG: Cof-type HAD-IIB family hydrolase [Fusobacteriaceae bacterium]
MKFKMIVTDLDDTLLNSEGKISERDKEAIMKAQEKGVKFILASGRPTFAMRHLADELQLHKYGSYIISYNGAIITRWDDKSEILNESLTKNDLHRLYDFSHKHKVHIITYLDDEIISESESKYINIEKELTGMNHKIVPSFKNAVNCDGVKCIMLENPDYLKEVEKKLKEELGHDYTIAISKPFFLEVTKKNMDKGNSLKKLIQNLEITSEEIIAVGDSYNDISMLKIAGKSVAVENAKPEIIEMVDYITSSNNNHGIAEVIEKFILNGEGNE